MVNREYKIGEKLLLVPETIPEDKVEIFIELQELEYQWENFEKFVILSNGNTLKLPNQGYKKIIKDEPKLIQSLVKEKIQTLSKLSGKRMYLKRVLKGVIPKGVKEIVDDNSSIMLEYFGKDYSITDVHRTMIKLGHEKLPYSYVQKFYHSNIEKIRELRNQYREDYSDVSISIKRSRLEKLNYLISDLLQEYEKTGISNKIFYSKEIRGLIEQARKEVEGDELKLTLQGTIDVNATINMKMNDSKVLQDLTVYQIVISRIAYRLGIPSQYLLDRLANSFYSKFNGFRRTENLRDTIVYPSSINYDILELENKNKQLTQLVKVEDIEPLKEEEKQKVSVNKEILQMKIEKLLQNNNKNRTETK